MYPGVTVFNYAHTTILNSLQFRYICTAILYVGKSIRIRPATLAHYKPDIGEESCVCWVFILTITEATPYQKRTQHTGGAPVHVGLLW